MSLLVMLLLVLYQLKHFIADYPLQGRYMLRKFLPYPDFVLPLLAHSFVHSVMTFCIALFIKPDSAIFLGLLDMVIHFIVDRIKAAPNLGGRFKQLTKETYPTSTNEEKKSNVYFWWALGLDQMAHHLTHYFIIWRLVS